MIADDVAIFGLLPLWEPPRQFVGKRTRRSALGVYGLTKGQFSATADRVVRRLPPRLDREGRRRDRLRLS